MTFAGRNDTVRTLIAVGKQIKNAQKAWEDGIEIVKGQHIYHPSETQIRPSTTISEAIIILSRSLAHYNSRSQLHGRPCHSLTDIVRVHSSEPLKSSVTKTWHAKRCLAKAEQRLLARFQDLERVEALQSRNFSKLLGLHAQLLEFEQSEKMELIMKALALADHAHETLHGRKMTKKGVSRAEVDQVRWQLETATDFTSEFRALLGVHDRSISLWLWIVSLIVEDVPRQMMIMEFFKTVR